MIMTGTTYLVVRVIIYTPMEYVYIYTLSYYRGRLATL